MAPETKAMTSFQLVIGRKMIRPTRKLSSRPRKGTPRAERTDRDPGEQAVSADRHGQTRRGPGGHESCGVVIRGVLKTLLLLGVGLLLVWVLFLVGVV